MSDDLHGTKEALLEAAGELFADYGFDGASTRMIAEKAGVNIAAINYHFGGKENLYLATLHAMLDKGSCSWTRLMDRAATLAREGASTEYALYTVLREHLTNNFGDDIPRWRAKLILRAMQEPSPVLKSLSTERFIPEIQAIVETAREWNPELTQEEAVLWADSLLAQVIFYTLARGPILYVRGWEAYPAEFLDEAARHIARVMVTALTMERSAGSAPKKSL